MRAVGHRPRHCVRTQSAHDLRTHDRLRPRWPTRSGCGSRHRLHRVVRCAVDPRPRRAKANASDQPCWRLRWRWVDARNGHRCCSVRAKRVGARPSHRRRNGRWCRARCSTVFPGHIVGILGATWHQSHRHRRPLLRGLRMRRWGLCGARRNRATVLCRVAGKAGALARRFSAVGSRTMASTQTTTQRHLHRTDPRSLVRVARRLRGLFRSGAVARRGQQASPQRCPRHLR